MYVPADRKRRAVSSTFLPGCEAAELRGEFGLAPSRFARSSSRALFITIVAAREDIGLLKLKPIRLSRHCALAGANERHNQTAVSDIEMLTRESLISSCLLEKWGLSEH